MRLGGYIRVSRVGDRAETIRSPDDQEKAIAQWGREDGHQIVMLPRELDQSGGKDDRPILNGAIAAIERRELEGLVVYNFARMTRTLRHSLEVRERVKAAGGRIVSITQPVDDETWQGRQTANLLASVDQAERERQAETFEQGKANAINDGIYIAAKPPIGYLKGDDRRLYPDPEVAPVIREVFERRAAGQSWKALAGFMEERLGRPFLRAAVRYIVKNRCYLGEARQGDIVNPNAHEAIVDEATWLAAQRHQPRPPRGDHPALLAGLVRCAGCQRVMTPTHHRGRRFYRCRRDHSGGRCPEPASINGRIEDYVEQAVLAHLRDMQVTAASRTDAVEEASRELQRAEAERDAFLEQTQALDADREHFARGATLRVEAVEKARQKLSAARGASAAIPAPETVERLWPSLSIEERRQVLRGALDVVWVRRGRADLHNRVRLIASGYGPPDLTTRGGKHAGPVVSLDWDADLPGELRVAGS